MNDSWRRSVRTGIDLILGFLASVAAVLLVPGIDGVFEELELGGQLATFSVVVLALTTFFSKLKNQLEDAGRIKPRLKGEEVYPEDEWDIAA